MAPPALFSRDESATEHVMSLSAWLLQTNVQVTLSTTDLGSTAEVHGVFSTGGQTSNSSLSTGYFDVVMHAAGILQDGLIDQQSQASIRKVMAPKLGAIATATNVLTATIGIPVQQLALFSSIASCIGAPGQANYVSANAVLDGWAEAGRQQGCSVSSIQWGAWATAGECHRCQSHAILS
jgi:short-subunit dehydrogenase